MTKAVAASFMLSMLALASCTTAGPDYHLPDEAAAVAPAANRPFLGSDRAAFAQSDPPDHWWELYADPTTNTLVEQALAANTDLRAAEANLRRASAVVRAAETARQVSTGVSASGALARPDGTGGSLPGTIGYDIGVGVELPLDLSGKIRRAIEAARGDEEAVAAARDGVRIAVAASTTRAYAAVCSANHQFVAAQRVLEIQRRSLDVTRRLARGGRGTAFDVSRAQAAVDQTAAELPQFIAARDAGLFMLAALLGRAPSEYPPGVATCAMAPVLSHPLPTGEGASLIKRRPDVRAAERQLAADTARIGVVTADLYPQVSLGGSLGLTGPIAGFGSGNAFRTGLGPLISWTFPNRRLTRAGIDQATAAADTSLAQFDGAVLESLRQVETALSNYSAEIDRNGALLRARNSASLAQEQANKLYQFGRTDFLPLLTAQNSLAAAEAALASSDVALTQRQIDVFVALGGGWQR